MWINPQFAKKFPGDRVRTRRLGKRSASLRAGFAGPIQPCKIGIVDWHNYCTETVIRGDNRKVSDFQVGIRLSPRLHISGLCRSGKGDGN